MAFFGILKNYLILTFYKYVNVIDAMTYIFLIVFSPTIEYIKTFREKKGYQLSTETNAMFVNTTPFADDFNVMSRNIKQHQTLVTDVEKKLHSMGLVIKAPKCVCIYRIMIIGLQSWD